MKKQTKKSLIRSEHRFRSLVQQSSDIIMVFNQAGMITYQSPAIHSILGYEHGIESSRQLLKNIHPSDRKELITFFNKCRGKNQSHLLIEFRIRHADGHYIYIETIANNLLTKKYVRGIIFNAREITNRKQAQIALLKSEERFRLMAEHIQDGLIIVENDEVVYMNQKICEILGYPPDELKYLTGVDIAAPEEINKVRRIREEAFQNKRYPFEFEYWIIRKDGARRYIRNHYSRTQMGDREHVFIITSDLTKHKLSEEMIRAERERLMITLKSIADGVIATDTLGTIQLTNPVAQELLKLSEEKLYLKNIDLFFHLRDLKSGQTILNPINSMFSNNIDLTPYQSAELILSDGIRKIIEYTSSQIRDQNQQVIGAVLVFRDITQKQRMEEELFKNQKIESLGILAGGIAHDFNNILTGFLGNISLVKLYAIRHQLEPVTERMREAENAVIKAKELTHQLLTFSKGGIPIKKTTSINNLIHESASFLLRGSNIKIEIQFPSDIGYVDIDEGQINQVIHNLVINAKEAMPEGGVITITGINCFITPDMGIPLVAGKYVKITFTDQGHGIAPEHIKKIFDPYFTTKSHGNGLGLAITYSVIRKHNGYISVQSTPSRGSTFTIYLPMSTNTLNSKTDLDNPLHSGNRYRRILIMDDDQMILDTVADLLSFLGYNVITAHDGQEALNLYSEALKQGKNVDLVIMDLTIPGGMGGKETIKKLMELDPSARAIVSSGYSNDPIMAAFRDYGFMGVVAKPFKIEELSQIIDGILG